MNKDSILILLQKLDIFHGIPKDLLNQLADKLEIISFIPGKPIIHKGDHGDSMFIIAAGKVKIHDGEHTVAYLEAGSFFGEFSLLDAAPRSMSVTAVDEVKTISIGRELFFTLLQSQPDVTQKMISTLTGRLRRQNESIINQFKNREAELTRLVDERTIELMMKNKEITDNVNYAKRIQAAILPDIKIIQKTFPDSFVLYLPKDIVSGDFYSFFPNEDGGVITAADCTGHGVTGAFLSVIGNSLLNQIINEKKIKDPGIILDNLHEEMIIALNQRNSDSTDGMDVSICSVDIKKNQLRYAGANRPLWIVRNNEIIIHAANKFPVGGLQILHDSKFNSHLIQLEKDDSVYIFTDGYADQFGGELGKKMMTKKFKEVLVSIQNLKMDDQKKFLKDFFENWKGKQEQVDDVLVLGIRII